MARILFPIVFAFLFSTVNIKSQVIIPMDYSGHLYLKGSLNDAPLSQFVFDTGAASLYVDTCYYAESGIKFKKLAVGALPGVGQKAQKVKIVLDPVKYTFSDNVYCPEHTVLFSLKPILGDYADGIIGKDYFANSCLEVDYEHNLLKRYNSVSEIDLTGYEKLEGKNIGGKLAVPLSIVVSEDIVIKDYFLLDLGSAGTIHLTSPIARQYKFNDMAGPKVKYYAINGGVGGKAESYAIPASEILIAGYTLDDMKILYSLDESGSLASEKHAGLLGNKIMERFSVIIDFKNNVLYLKPNSDYGKAFNKSTFGFTSTNRYKTLGAWIVNGLYEGMPAERNGMEAGDKIIEVNGYLTKNIETIAQEKELLKSDTLTLKIERAGSPLTITIQKQNLFPH